MNKKTTIILFIVILVLGILSNGFKARCIGTPDCLTSTQEFTNQIPKFTSPGINALLNDNGFFINYKPLGTFDMIAEGALHITIDLIYWFILAFIISYLLTKIKPKKSNMN